MKARNRPARDGDETERKDLSRENRSGAIGESRERRQLQFGPHEEYPYRQHHNYTELDERAQVVARRQQQPHRQRAGQESVENDGDGESHRAST